LQERGGVLQPENINASAAEIARKRKAPDSDAIINGIRKGDVSALGRGITLVESTNPDHASQAAAVISGCLPYAGKSVRIGISGVPGVGKSTFIEAFGKYLTGIGKKVAVLAVDPSSSISRGSILGDKTRMEELVRDPNAYIRPSASGENLGGVARKTREAITLCEAAGYDVILIETVGVGQSETAVQGMTDFFLLLQIAGAGDELQGIKRGIMEIADMVAVNKADGDNFKKARLAKAEISRALHFFPEKESGWAPKAVTCSALTKEGVPEIWETVTSYLELAKNNDYFDQRREAQQQYWMHESINESLLAHFYNKPEIAEMLEQQRQAVARHEISPFAAAQRLLEFYFKK